MKKIIFFILCFALSGCGSSGTFLDDFLVISGRNMADIDDYFDLSSQQRAQLEKNIDSDLNHLRKDRFDKVAKTLRDIEKNTQKPGNKKTLSIAYVDLQKQYMDASPYFKDSTEKLISSLQESQIKSFKKKVEKEIAETKANLKNPEVLNEELIGRYKKGLEYWLGDLTQAQQKSIVQFTKDHPYPWNEKNKNKEFVLKRFMAVQKNKEELRKFSEDFISDYPSVRTPEYASAIAAYEKEFQNFLDSFWPTLTSDQKNILQEYLLSRAEKLELLAKGP